MQYNLYLQSDATMYLLAIVDCVLREKSKALRHGERCICEETGSRNAKKAMDCCCLTIVAPQNHLNSLL